VSATAKQTGLGWSVFSVADASGTAQDLRDDITTLSFSTPRGVQDVTGIGVSAHERLLLLADISYDISGVFDNGSTAAHEVFATIPSTSVNRAISCTVSGSVLGPCNCLLTDYAVSRSATGELTYKVPAVLADGNVPAWSGTV
jgi:hypothetical protein